MSPLSSTPQGSPFVLLIERLAHDGLTYEAARLDILLHRTAWTTGTEFLGAFGKEMRTMRRSVRLRASDDTKAAFKAAKRAVTKAWPWMFWF